MNTYFERQQHKTSEGELLYELINSYSCSPKESESILETAKRCLVRENILKEGEIETSVIAIEERSGKVIEKLEKVRVRLTVDNGNEDTGVLSEFGRRELRRVQIQRITNEAIEQGGVLSQEDLSRYLRCSIRTIKRDIKAIKVQGVEIVTRGVLHSIGRGQTHKVKIVGLFLDGKTFSDIKRLTRHSVGAIKRYAEGFVKVLMSYHNRIRGIREISSVTGLTENLVSQYIELLDLSKKDRRRRATMENLIAQWKRAGTRVKKSSILSEFGLKAVPMTGGGI